MKRKVLIVEDNDKSRKMLVKLINDIEGISVTILEADKIDAAYKYAMQYTIDLFIIDIIIDTSVRDDTSGMRFATHIREMDQYKLTPIIFITSLEDHELFAYSELHCYQYMEKPYDEAKATIKIKEALGLTVDKKDDRRMFFRKDGLIFPTLIRDIVLIECSKPFMKVYLKNDFLKIAYQPLKNILRELDSRDFLQCNRNTVVNKNYIENIDLTNKFIKMKHQDFFITLGNAYDKKFMSELKNG